MYEPSRVACKRLGVHENTLRAWADAGKIDHIRTESGQRRYDVDAFLRGRGASAEVCYCRVSSRKQRDDLARQSAFMQEKFPQAEIIEDIGDQPLPFGKLKDKFVHISGDDAILVSKLLKACGVQCQILHER